MDTNYEHLLNEFENKFKELYKQYHPDSKEEDNKLWKAVNELRKYPGKNYPVTSTEGEAIEKMLFALIEIDGLSREEDRQRNTLANMIIEIKLKDYV